MSLVGPTVFISATKYSTGLANDYIAGSEPKITWNVNDDLSEAILALGTRNGFVVVAFDYEQDYDFLCKMFTDNRLVISVEGCFDIILEVTEGNEFGGRNIREDIAAKSASQRRSHEQSRTASGT